MGAGADCPHARFHFQPARLDGVEIWAVRWEEGKTRSTTANEFADGRPIVGAEVVHDDYVVRLGDGKKPLSDVGLEASTFGGTLESQHLPDSSQSQFSNHRDYLTTAHGHESTRALPTGRAPISTSHGEGSGSLVDEVDARGIQLGGLTQMPLSGPAILRQPSL